MATYRGFTDQDCGMIVGYHSSRKRSVSINREGMCSCCEPSCIDVSLCVSNAVLLDGRGCSVPTCEVSWLHDLNHSSCTYIMIIKKEKTKGWEGEILRNE